MNALPNTVETVEAKPVIHPLERIGKVALTLTHRPFVDEDYRTAHKWWRKHNRGHLEHFLLSPLGIVVENHGKPVAMGWLYLSNAKMCQMGWVVTDPELGPKLKMAAIIRLYVVAEAEARSLGYTAIQMMADSPVLSKVAMALGWKKLIPHDFLLRSLMEDDGDV